MRLTLVLIALLFTSGAFAQQYSRDFIKSGKFAKDFSSYLTSQCYQDLKTFYSQGKLLTSRTFINHSLPLSTFGKKGDSDLEFVRNSITKTPSGFYTFYHYTKETSLANAFQPDIRNRDSVWQETKNYAFTYILSFIKNPNRGTWFNPQVLRVNKGFLYISSCPTCSSGFGPIQLSFTFSPEAKIIDVRSFDWSTAEYEMKDKYPEVFHSCDFKIMGLFALEDSGIDILRYDDNWYQLTNFSHVLNSDVLVLDHTDDDGATRQRAGNRIYSLSLSMAPASSVSEPGPAPSPIPAVNEEVSTGIEVLEATWLKSNDSLENAKSHCDGKDSCLYKVLEKYLPGVKYNANRPKPFTIKWKCSANGSIKSHTIPSDARGQSYNLTCQ
jgi:hypothetical protein